MTLASHAGYQEKEMTEEKKQGQKFAATRIWMKPDDELSVDLGQIQSFAPLPDDLLNFEVPDKKEEQNVVAAILAQQNPHLFV